MLPKLLTTISGERIRTASEWEKYRRGECLALLTEYVYGKTPTSAPNLVWPSFWAQKEKAWQTTPLNSAATPLRFPCPTVWTL